MTDDERKARNLLAQAKWRAKNRDQERARSKAFKAAHPEQTRAQQAAYRCAQRDQIKARRAAWCAAHRENIRAQAKAQRQKRAADIRAVDRAYRQAHPDQLRETKQRYRQTHHEREQAYRQAYNASHREALTTAHRTWARANKGKVTAAVAKRAALRLKATPPWADLSTIAALYDTALRMTAETGVRWEVDHVIPLQSTIVCGLHVETNLQLLTKSDNARKHNRFVTQWTSGPAAHAAHIPRSAAFALMRAITSEVNCFEESAGIAPDMPSPDGIGGGCGGNTACG